MRQSNKISPTSNADHLPGYDVRRRNHPVARDERSAADQAGLVENGHLPAPLVLVRSVAIDNSLLDFLESGRRRRRNNRNWWICHRLVQIAVALKAADAAVGIAELGQDAARTAIAAAMRRLASAAQLGRHGAILNLRIYHVECFTADGPTYCQLYTMIL